MIASSSFHSSMKRRMNCSLVNRSLTRKFHNLPVAWVIGASVFSLFFLDAVGATPSPGTLSPPRIVIAHRGGVVDTNHSENSLSGLEEAIRRGYTHVEVDARCTADGFVVCFHNDSLAEEAGVVGRVSQLPLAKLRRIILIRSQQPIPTFDEFSARCAGRINLMVDLKGCPENFVEGYANQIDTALRRHRLLSNALILINKTPIKNQDKIIPYFYGKCRVSWRQDLAATQRAAANEPSFQQRYYVFNHGADFTTTSVKGFQELGLSVVVSINTQHYQPRSSIDDGKDHIEQMLRFGVDGLQIDSIYDPVLFGP